MQPQDAKLITLKQARVIEAVARARGFEHAARDLNMSQPVISRAVAAAEKVVGVPLFQRGWGGTEPTIWGESVLARCARALEILAKAEDDIFEIGGTRPNLRNFLEWRHLVAVSAVVRLGSASLASRDLNVTQPAISRSIRAISEYCGQPLFIRRRSGLEPTPQAQRLAALRDELLQELTSIGRMKLGKREKRGLLGRLAVGMLPFSGQDLVAKTLGTLTSRHPELRLMALPGSYNMLAGALRRGEIDCMIGILRDPPPFSDLYERELCSERFTMIARRDHPCHRGRPTISALKSERWIVAPHGTPVRTYFNGLFHSIGATPPTQTCEILSFSNAEKVVMNSDSIGLLPYSEQHLANLPAELKKVDIDLPGAEVLIGLTLRRNIGSEQILDEFEALLRGYYA